MRIQLLRWLGKYTLCNAFFFFLIAFWYAYTHTFFDDWITELFFIIALVGQFGFFALVLITIPGLVSILVYPKKWFSLHACILITSLGLFALLGETVLFAKYFYHINLGLLQMIFSGSLLEALDLSNYELFLISLIFVFILVLEVILGRWLWRSSKYYTLLFVTFISLTLLSLITAQVAYIWATLSGRQNLIQSSVIIPLFRGVHHADLFLIGHNLIKPSDLYKNFQHTEFKSGILNYPKKALIEKTRKEYFNIVVIGIDAWRFDTLTQEITPNIFNFSKQNLRFTEHYSGGNCTKTGLFALFYGLPASYWETTQVPPVLLEEFRKHRYETKILSSAGIVYPALYQNVFKNIKNLNLETQGKSPWSRDKKITDDALTFLDHVKYRKTPFFMFMFYDSAHAYETPPDFKVKFKPQWERVNRLALNNNSDPNPPFNRYKNGLNYVDGLVGQVLLKLRQQNLLKNTIVILTTDHGEEFNDNHLNYWGHGSNFTKYQIKIPLVVHWPEMKTKAINYQTTSYDIVPTLMSNVFGITNSFQDYSIGSDLFKDSQMKYFVASSFAYNGLISSDRIIYFYPGSRFLTTSLDSVKIDNKIGPNLMTSYLNSISSFYKATN